MMGSQCLFIHNFHLNVDKIVDNNSFSFTNRGCAVHNPVDTVKNPLVIPIFDRELSTWFWGKVINNDYPSHFLKIPPHPRVKAG
jgi:hypothetical protein